VNDGGVNSGTIVTDNNIDLDGDHYFTLATTEGAPLPAAGFLTQDTTICAGSTITLRVQVTGNPDYEIDVDDGTSTSTYSGSASPITFDVTPGATITYTITEVTEDTDGSDGGPVASTTTIFGDPVTVTVVSLPTPTIVPAKVLQEFCAGETTNYSVTDNAGNTYTWVVTGGNILAGQGTNTVSVEWLTDPGTITVTEETPEGCSGVDDIDPVIIFALPTAIDQTPAPICSEVAGETVQITGLNLRNNDDLITASSGDGVTWYYDAALNNLVTDATDVDINDVFGGGTNITKIFYAEVNNGNCTDVATVTYTIYRVPETGPQYHISNDWSN